MNSTLYIHLSKLGQNLEVIRSRIGDGVKCMAVVKDQAYGHGLIPIAKYLQDKVDWFCVAEIKEAIRLRKEGIKNPILVFEIPNEGKQDLYREYNITASISDISVFERLEPGTDCHLHFDTGMMRLGMLPAEVPEVLQKMKEHPALNYSGIYTHFANADGDGSPTVENQLEVFKDIRAQFPSKLLTHTSNSGGVLYHNQQGFFEAVRTGIALYGYSPGAHIIPELQPIIEWKSKLVQVKKIRGGEAVGYGSRWKAPNEGWLGIVPVGYSDGISRTLSGKFSVEIEAQRYPQVGTISMDYMAVFLGSDQLKTGTTVKLLGEGELSAKQWAQKSSTIAYEITTRLSRRIRREYLL